MSRPLPQTFHELVEEVLRFTGLSRETVEERIWQESLQPGWNVGKELATYRVTPHHYNREMEQLYSAGTGFIFETLVFWAKPWRRAWAPVASQRLMIQGKRQGMRTQDLKILMLGDGTGSDSIFLASQGFNVDYHDVPGSRTWEFAMKRFEYYGILGNRIHPVLELRDCLSSGYDAVVSFEVLEHLTNPTNAIEEICRLLRPGGIALVTESFGLVTPELPTHLASNLRYAGRTPFLFLRKHLLLSWYDKISPFKPMEYVKIKKGTPKDYLCLIANRLVLRHWLAGRKNRIKRAVKHWFPL